MENDWIYGHLMKLVLNQNWDELIKFVEKENFDVNTRFLIAPKLPKPFAPTLLHMLIPGKAPQHVFKWIFDLGAKAERFHYRLAVHSSNPPFLREMKDRGVDLNITVGAKSLYEVASEVKNSPMYEELNKLGVDPNLFHGSGEKDLLYRMLENNRVYEAVELIRFGTFVGNDHLSVTSSELYEYVKTKNCETSM